MSAAESTANNALKRVLARAGGLLGRGGSRLAAGRKLLSEEEAAAAQAFLEFVAAQDKEEQGVLSRDTGEVPER